MRIRRRGSIIKAGAVVVFPSFLIRRVFPRDVAYQCYRDADCCVRFIWTLPPLYSGRSLDCVTVSVLHYAAFNVPVDDLSTRRAGSEWVAAAGEGGTVDRDWCNRHLGRFLAVNTAGFFVVISVNRFRKLYKWKATISQVGQWGWYSNEDGTKIPSHLTPRT